MATISKHVQNMRFMQRRRLDNEKAAQAQAAAESAQASHWVAEGAGQRSGAVVVVEPSFVDFEDLLLYGRQSFRDQNPDVQKQAKAEVSRWKRRGAGASAAARPASKPMDTAVSDEDMAKRYAKFINKKEPAKPAKVAGSPAAPAPVAPATAPAASMIEVVSSGGGGGGGKGTKRTAEAEQHKPNKRSREDKAALKGAFHRQNSKGSKGGKGGKGSKGKKKRK